MGGHSFHAQRVFSDALAGGLESSVEPGGGFENQYCGALLRQRFGDLARRIASDFFIGNQQDRHRPWQALPVLKRFNRMECERDAGLHVENAGPVQMSLLDFAGHAGQRSEGIDGVVMAKQQDRLAAVRVRAGTGEIDLQVIAEVIAVVKMNASAERLKFGCEKASYAVDCLLVVAGGFDFDELTNR